jgi:hypothetical protein
MSVFAYDIKPLIARLDPGTFTAFVAGLLTAEVASLRVSPDRLAISSAITTNDEGLDAWVIDATSWIAIPLRSVGSDREMRRIASGIETATGADITYLIGS